MFSIEHFLECRWYADTLIGLWSLGWQERNVFYVWVGTEDSLGPVYRQELLV